MEDINKATFEREAERKLSGDSLKEEIAKFANLQTAEDRVTAFRKLCGGSVTKSASTKLGSVPHTR